MFELKKENMKNSQIILGISEQNKNFIKVEKEAFSAFLKITEKNSSKLGLQKKRPKKKQ
jgi:hypothetical protein